MKYLFSPGNLLVIGLAMVGSGVYAFCEFTGILKNPEVQRWAMQHIFPIAATSVTFIGIVVWVWITMFIERRKAWRGVVVKAYFEKEEGSSTSQFVIAYQKRDGGVGVYKMDAELAAITYEKGVRKGDRIVKPRGQDFPRIAGG